MCALLYRLFILGLFLLGSLFSFYSCSSENKMEKEIELNKDIAIIAHAGGVYGPPNSIQSISHSFAIGTDAVEVDIRITKDSVVILSHDDDIALCSNGSGQVKNLAYNDLCTFYLWNVDGSISSGKYPQLADVLDLVGKDGFLILEIKDYTDDLIIQKIAEIIREKDLYSKVAVTSFGFSCLNKINQIDSHIKCHYLLNQDSDIDALALNPDWDFISTIVVNYNSVTKGIINKVHSIGKKINIYTLNSFDEISSDLYCNVDGIITDYPEMWLSKKKY